MSVQQLADQTRALEELTTLRGAAAQLKAQNTALRDSLAQKEREAAEALNQLKPLQEQSR